MATPVPSDPILIGVVVAWFIWRMVKGHRYKSRSKEGGD